MFPLRRCNYKRKEPTGVPEQLAHDDFITETEREWLRTGQPSVSALFHLTDDQLSFDSLELRGTLPSWLCTLQPKKRFLSETRNVLGYITNQGKSWNTLKNPWRETWAKTFLLVLDTVYWKSARISIRFVLLFFCPRWEYWKESEGKSYSYLQWMTGSFQPPYESVRWFCPPHELHTLLLVIWILNHVTGPTLKSINNLANSPWTGLLKGALVCFPCWPKLCRIMPANGRSAIAHIFLVWPVREWGCKTARCCPCSFSNPVTGELWLVWCEACSEPADQGVGL